MRNYLILGLALILSACAGSVPTGAIATSGSSDEKKIVACILRYEAGVGWYAIDDAGHTPIGVREVRTGEHHAEIYFEDEFKDIYTFIATTDETYAANGIFVGASVGLAVAYVRFHKNVNGTMTPVRSEDMEIEGSNIWIYGLFR